MGQYSKSSEKNIFKHKEDFTWKETDVVKDGRKMRIVVPDGKVGYGDTESHAQLTGDLAAKHSDDTKAGEKAYESAREQSQQDWQKRKKQMAYQKMKAQMPLMKQYTITDKNGDPIQHEFIFLKTDENGLTYPLKKIVDAQSGKVRNG